MIKNKKSMYKQIKSIGLGLAIAAFAIVGASAQTNVSTNAPIVKTNAVKTVAAPAKLWSFTLTGVGATAVNGNATTFATEVGLSRLTRIVVPVDLGVRQDIGYASVGSKFTTSTEVFTDVQLTAFNRFSIFAGPNVRYAYGDQTAKITVGPEAGVKVGLAKNVYSYGRANYDFVLNGNKLTATDTIRYTVGIGIKF